ncbi:hypothetical protein Trydic_g9449, partial [Trypoxylus dichotomus]
MNVAFRLVLIHAAVVASATANDRFVPAKSYELEVNQTRTNLKLKIGKNGDGRIIENILKPLFATNDSSQVAIKETSNKCNKKICKQKCVKRKKVCLKGDLDTLLRKTKRKNGLIYIRIRNVNQSGVQNQSKNNQQKHADVVKENVNLGRFNIGKESFPQSRSDNHRNKGQHKVRYDRKYQHRNLIKGYDISHARRRKLTIKEKNLRQKGSNSKRHKEARKHDSKSLKNKNINVSSKHINRSKGKPQHSRSHQQFHNNTNQGKAFNKKKVSKQTHHIKEMRKNLKKNKSRNCKVKDEGNKPFNELHKVNKDNRRGGISKQRIHDERKRKIKKKGINIADKFKIVEETNVGFGLVIPVTPNNLLSMHIPPKVLNAKSGIWYRKKKAKDRKEAHKMNKGSYRRRGRMLNDLASYNRTDIDSKRANPSLLQLLRTAAETNKDGHLRSNLVKEYKVVMGTSIKFRHIPVNIEDGVAVKLGEIKSVEQEGKHVKGDLKSDNQQQASIPCSSLAINNDKSLDSTDLSYRRVNDGNYIDYEDNGNIEIYEEITDNGEDGSMGPNEDFALPSSYTPKINPFHVTGNPLIYINSERSNVQIYVSNEEKTVIPYIYAYHQYVTTPKKTCQTSENKETPSSVTEADSTAGGTMKSTKLPKDEEDGIVVWQYTDYDAMTTNTEVNNLTESKDTAYNSTITVKSTIGSKDEVNSVANATEPIYIDYNETVVSINESTVVIANETGESTDAIESMSTDYVSQPENGTPTANLSESEYKNNSFTSAEVTFDSTIESDGEATAINNTIVSNHRGSDTVAGLTTKLESPITFTKSITVVTNFTNESETVTESTTTITGPEPTDYATHTVVSEDITTIITNKAESKYTDFVTESEGITTSKNVLADFGQTFVTSVVAEPVTNVSESTTTPTVTESETTDFVATMYVDESTTKSEDVTIILPNTTEPKRTDQKVTSVVTEFTVESEGTIANASDVNESIFTDFVTITEQAKSAAVSESTLGFVSNITKSTDNTEDTIVTISVKDKSTAELTSAFESVPNTTEPKFIVHATGTVVISNITDSNSKDFVKTTVIAESATESTDVNTFISNTTQSKVVNDFITTAVTQSEIESKDSTESTTTQTEYADYITTTIAAETSEEYIDTFTGEGITIDSKQHNTEVKDTGVKTPNSPAHINNNDIENVDAPCEIVVVEEEIDCSAVNEEDGCEIEEDCEEVETAGQVCDDDVENNLITPSGYEPSSHQGNNEEPDQYNTITIIEDAKETFVIDTTTEDIKETFVTDTTTEDIKETFVTGTTTEDIKETSVTDTTADDIEETFVTDTTTEDIEETFVTDTTTESSEETFVTDTTTEDIEETFVTDTT